MSAYIRCGVKTARGNSFLTQPVHHVEPGETGAHHDGIYVRLNGHCRFFEGCVWFVMLIVISDNLGKQSVILSQYIR